MCMHILWTFQGPVIQEFFPPSPVTSSMGYTPGWGLGHLEHSCTHIHLRASSQFPQGHISISHDSHIRGFTASPDTISSWKPSVQTHECVGGISHSNYNKNATHEHVGGISHPNYNKNAT